jgi:peptide/nickel transport system permease protein
VVARSQVGQPVPTPAMRRPWVDERLATTRVRSPWEMVWRQFRRNPGAIVGTALLVAIVLAAVLAPYLAHYAPDDQLGESRLPPGQEFWLGTDVFGRDIYSRILYGGRLSLAVGVVSVGIGLSAGIVLGLLAGYYGHKVDAVVMMAVDIMLSFPGILLAMGIIAILGVGLQNVMVAVGISAIPAYTRLVRSSVLSTKNLAFVEAARVVGAGNGRVMFRHVLPSVFGPVIVLATLSIATAILSAAGLSFLGLGAQPPTPEWGAMVSDGRDYLRAAWWIAGMPGFAIMLAVMAVNLVGDGLRDALDPRLRQ